MRITVLANGSRGDVQPYLALAKGLQRAGHSVLFAANSNFAELANDFGLDFFGLNVDSFAFVQDKRARKWLDSGNFLELALYSNRVIRPTVDTVLRDAWEACQGTEAIIYHSFTMPSVFFIGEQLGVPCLPANIYPEPTREYPALPLNTRRKLPGLLNLLSHLLLDLFGWQIYRPGAKDLFGNKLSIPIASPSRQIRKERRPMFCAYSSTVLPRPDDLPDHVHLTGYWTLEPSAAWQPDPKLVQFLQTGESPVYVGFGSMGAPEKAMETTDLVVRALTQLGVRGVLDPGWSGLGLESTIPDTMIVIDPLPHSWLFPRMKVIVHHGGVGTTAAGLRAGVPNVVVPHFSDSFFWARRIVSLGAGPQPIPRKMLTSEGLASAIERAMNDHNMCQRAAAIGQQLESEDGVAKAIEIFHQYVDNFSKEILAITK